jgi:hypothetical protein
LGVVAKFCVYTVTVLPLEYTKSHRNCQWPPVPENVCDIVVAVVSEKLVENEFATLLV